MPLKRTSSTTLPLVLIALLSASAWAATEGDCRCHDNPGFPCVYQEITLTDVQFPATFWDEKESKDKESVALAHLVDEWGRGNSEVWVLIEAVPASDRCSACGQTYILYAPGRAAENRTEYKLFSGKDVALTASRVVFSMTECTEATDVSIRMAIIEEDDDYEDSLELVQVLFGLVLAETGKRSGATAEKTGWSVRLDGAWLDSLFAQLTLDTGNDVVLPITKVSSPVRNDVARPRFVRFPNEEAPIGQVDVYLKASSREIKPCSLRCGEGSTPTSAEKHLSGRKQCALASLARIASPGFTSETAPSANLPANAQKQDTAVKKTTYTRPDGSKVELIFVVRVVHFADDSRYLESYTLKRVTAKDGTVKESVLDCLQSAWLLGADSARIRSLLETHKEKEVTRHYAGGCASDAFSLPDAVEWGGGTGEVPDTVTVTVPAGITLDLTALPTGAGPLLVAEKSITIHADEILLSGDSSLAALMSPSPVVVPGTDALRLLAPEVVSVLPESDIVPIVLANQSGIRDTISLVLSDTQGWVLPQTREIALAAGQAEAVWITVSVGGEDRLTGSSVLTVVASSQRLGTVRELVELRLASPAETATEAGTGLPAVTAVSPLVVGEPPQPPGETAQIHVPEDIVRCARTLAWKGGQLGRLDPSQRWSAREDRPGEYCEPCGHVPMCVECMEWDLQAWQRRQKTLTDVMNLMALLSYLNQVSGRPEYHAVATIYWEAHWDGWHNRNPP